MDTPSATPVGEQYESVVRDMISRENDLTNQRMLWMAAFNGLLFAALGFAWAKLGPGFLPESSQAFALRHHSYTGSLSSWPQTLREDSWIGGTPISRSPIPARA